MRRIFLENKVKKASIFDAFSFTPLFADSKTPTSKFGECEEVRWESGYRLVWANNQWGMDKTPTD
ncbi:hypothetical protein VK90_21185 [Bacillus sp. LK2]|nr:hypothetical protein VK90_21185 [Bacillus sp. LK2]